MSKAATMKNHRILYLVGAAAMVIAMMMALIVPKLALAAEDSLPATFDMGNGVIVTDNVGVWTVADVSTTSMSPHVAYDVKVDVYDTNTLNDLTTITVILFYDADGTYSAGEQVGADAEATHATFTWTQLTDTFAKTGPAGSWDIDDGNSVTPTLTDAVGTFEFRITIGDVATQTVDPARWHVYAVATDGSSPDSDTAEGLTTEWYGAITINTGSVAWTTVTPGMDWTDCDAAISVTYVSNGQYYKAIKSDSATWTGVANATQVDSDTPGQQQFALKATDSTTELDAVRFLTTYVDIGVSASQTTELGTDDDSNTIWLKTGTPFTTGTYSGTIFFQISDSAS
jgi:hypothetical protein